MVRMNKEKLRRLTIPICRDRLEEAGRAAAMADLMKSNMVFVLVVI